MPTNKVLADDDPELLELLKGGGLKADTIKDRERFLGQFKEFVLKETGKALNRYPKIDLIR